jgi:hypothetical protein
VDISNIYSNKLPDCLLLGSMDWKREWKKKVGKFRAESKIQWNGAGSKKKETMT